MSCLEAHAGFFRLLMSGIFNAFGKKIIHNASKIRKMNIPLEILITTSVITLTLNVNLTKKKEGKNMILDNKTSIFFFTFLAPSR